MTQIKAFTPEVAKEVGINASLLLQYIKYWVEKYGKEIVFRTNSQISTDFKETLSESQIQRAKKKLIEAGLVIVSHDKGHLRTTHYKLTEKAKGLLGMISAVVDEVKSVAKKVVKTVKKKSDNVVKSMSENFKNQGKTDHAIKMPDDVKQKLSGLLKKKPEPVIIPEVVEDEDLDYDEHFKALDAAFEQCNAPEQNKFSLSDLMSSAFNQIPNIEVLEKNRSMKEQARNFKEDY